MGKGKLAKFADMADYPHVFEYPYSVVEEVPFAMKGKWNSEFFGNDRPIVLELGCGRGEYTVGLARRYADKLMQLAQTVSSAASLKSSSTTLKRVSSLLSNYNGLQVGFQLEKQ